MPLALSRYALLLASSHAAAANDKRLVSGQSSHEAGSPLSRRASASNEQAMLPGTALELPWSKSQFTSRDVLREEGTRRLRPLRYLTLPWRLPGTLYGMRQVFKVTEARASDRAPAARP